MAETAQIVENSSGKAAAIDLSKKLRLHGDVFTFVVGPQKVELSAHENIISRSPVLKACCKPHFKEGLTKRIELPEDDPKIFHLLLEYLYTGRLEETKLKIEDTMEEWACLYILADKYQLVQLKSNILASLNVRQHLAGQITYLKWIHDIYANVPDSETRIQDFFISASLELLPLTLNHDLDELDRLVESGGRFAVDLSRRQNEVSRSAALGKARKQDELKHLKIKMEKDWKQLKDRLRRNHEAVHDTQACKCISDF